MAKASFMGGHPRRRLVLYSQDIAAVIGCSKRKGCDMIRDIRVTNEMPDGSFISVKLFCRYAGLEEEDVQAFLALQLLLFGSIFYWFQPSVHFLLHLLSGQLLPAW